MRLLLLSFFLLANTVFAQNETPALKFDTKFYDAVDNWVAFPSQKSDSIFNYGYIYIDEDAGFTFEIGNTFTITNDNKFIAKPPSKTNRSIYRIDKNWKPLAIIPKDKVAEMGLPEQPESMDVYKENSESASYLKNIGYFYNSVGASHQALEPLKKAYKKEPHFNGLEFELSFAYNALRKFEKAVPVLKKALENDPDNYRFYRELGFAYLNLQRFDEAEKIYRNGIALTEDTFQKSEMAVNMAQAYFQLKNKEKFKEWAEITRKHAKENSRYSQYIALFEKNWNKE